MFKFVHEGGPHGTGYFPPLAVGAADRRRQWVSWGTSALLHLLALILGALWLVRSVQFEVTPGQTSTDIDLILKAAPVAPRASPSPRDQVPQVVPLPSTLPLPRLAASQADIAVATAARSQTKLPAIAKTKLAKVLSKSKSFSTLEAGGASRGAVQAKPDDLHNDPPQYPDESRIRREQGMVTLQVRVTAEGTAAGVSILKSSGFYRLDQAALAVVRHWRFHPGTAGGVPVASSAEVPVRFKLE